MVHQLVIYLAKYVNISTINHSDWNYSPTQRFRTGAPASYVFKADLPRPTFRPPDQRDQRLERWRRHPGGDPPATCPPTMAMVYRGCTYNRQLYQIVVDNYSRYLCSQLYQIVVDSYVLNFVYLYIQRYLIDSCRQI